MADGSQYNDSGQPGNPGKNGNAASGMTARQSQLLAFIQGYTARNGRPPTYEEMKDALGLASKSGIHRLVHALDQRGHIRIGRRASARALIVGAGESVTTPMAISVVLSRCALSEAAERELRSLLALSDDAGNWCGLENEARP